MKKTPAKKTKWSKFARPDGTFDFESLSPEQKEEFYRETDENSGAPDAPLTAVERNLHARARRRGRPRKGRGAEVISLSIERSLLKRAERFAEAEGLSRSELFSRGLRAVLAVAGAA